MLTPGERDRIAMGNAESSTTIATLAETAKTFLRWSGSRTGVRRCIETDECDDGVTRV
jgi:hypothetical protein